MHRHVRPVLILASLVLASSCAQPRPHVEVTPAVPLDQASLITAAENFLRSFDNMDWEPFRASWSRNPTVFFPFADTPERVDGKAVEARFRTFFADVRSRRPGPPYLHLSPRDLRAETLGSAGVVTFTLGRRPGDIGRRTLLFVLENGEWKLAHLHASVIETDEP